MRKSELFSRDLNWYVGDKPPKRKWKSCKIRVLTREDDVWKIYTDSLEMPSFSLSIPDYESFMEDGFIHYTSEGNSIWLNVG